MVGFKKLLGSWQHISPPNCKFKSIALPLYSSAPRNNNWLGETEHDTGHIYGGGGGG